MVFVVASVPVRLLAYRFAGACEQAKACELLI